MLSGRDIILISSIEWDFNWQGHQEIANRLARDGNRVLYVENMGVRSPRLHDARRVAQRFFHWTGSLLDGGARQIAPNLYVCSPLILPPFGSPIQQRLNHRLFLPQILRAVKTLSFEPDIIWTFLPTDTAYSLINMLRKPQAVVVYYCVADFTELVPHPEKILKSERSIIKMSDLIFAQCSQLVEHCAGGGRSVEVFPFGVNLDLFMRRDGHEDGFAENGSKVGVDYDSTDNLMSALSGPIIGYIGGIHRHFDADMVAEMARARPDWSWVLVGPLQTASQRLKQIPNIHLTGPKKHKELPAYIRRFDVGIVPYLRNSYTTTVVPTKILEYLAMEKPVVSTSLPEVVAFNKKHKVIITSDNCPLEFAASIERALVSTEVETSGHHRRKVAALNGWEGRYEQMSSLIEQELYNKCRH